MATRRFLFFFVLQVKWGRIETQKRKLHTRTRYIFGTFGSGKFQQTHGWHQKPEAPANGHAWCWRKQLARSRRRRPYANNSVLLWRINPVWRSRYGRAVGSLCELAHCPENRIVHAVGNCGILERLSRANLHTHRNTQQGRWHFRRRCNHCRIIQERVQAGGSAHQHSKNLSNPYMKESDWANWEIEQNFQAIQERKNREVDEEREGRKRRSQGRC